MTSGPGGPDRSSGWGGPGSLDPSLRWGQDHGRRRRSGSWDVWRAPPRWPGLALALGCCGGPDTAELGEVPSAEQLYQEAHGDPGRRPRDPLGLRHHEVPGCDRPPPGHHRQLSLQRLRGAREPRDRRHLLPARELGGGPLLLPRLRGAPPRSPARALRAATSAALCHYQQSKEPGRDQSATKQAVTQLEELMRRFPDAPESREARGALARAAHAARQPRHADRRLLPRPRRVPERRGPLPRGAEPVPGPRARPRGALQARRLLRAHEPDRRGEPHLPGDPRQLRGHRGGGVGGRVPPARAGAVPRTDVPPAQRRRCGCTPSG